MGWCGEGVWASYPQFLLQAHHILVWESTPTSGLTHRQGAPAANTGSPVNLILHTIFHVSSPSCLCIVDKSLPINPTQAFPFRHLSGSETFLSQYHTC